VQWPPSAVVFSGLLFCLIAQPEPIWKLKKFYGHRRYTYMAKQLAFHDDARRSLKAGIDALAMAVSTTLGPKGRNVALDKKWGSPTVTHDGVTVAKEIELKDPYENMGAQLLKDE
jgi:hypothetical protein